MPEGAVYVGRPTPWGNPYRIGDDTVRNQANPTWLALLRGHDLACWCPLDVPCHADVLLELAA